MSAQNEKVEGCANNLRPDFESAPRKENIIKAKMPQGVESVKPTLVASKTRCMLAALADGSYFAVGRGENRKLYRRSYGMGGHVIGIPVNTQPANKSQVTSPSSRRRLRPWCTQPSSSEAPHERHHPEQPKQLHHQS